MTVPGWAEVFDGPCVEGEVVQAALEANGIQTVMRRTSPQSVFSGLDFEVCRVFVPEADAETARGLLETSVAEPLDEAAEQPSDTPDRTGT